MRIGDGLRRISVSLGPIRAELRVVGAALTGLRSQTWGTWRLFHAEQLSVNGIRSHGVCWKWFALMELELRGIMGVCAWLRRMGILGVFGGLFHGGEAAMAERALIELV